MAVCPRPQARRRAAGAVIFWALLAAGLAALSGCANPRVLEASDSAVTVRYDGTFTSLADATAAARKACAVHGKRARLRTVSFQGLGIGERYAHFACLNN